MPAFVPIVLSIILLQVVTPAPADPLALAGQQFLTLLAQAYIPILVSVLFTLTVPLLNSVRKWAAAHLSAAQLDALKQFVNVATLAIEQSHLGDEVLGLSQRKKGEALKLIQDYLDTHNLTGISAAQIDAMLEAAVMENFNHYGTFIGGTTVLSPPTDNTTSPSSS